MQETLGTQDGTVSQKFLCFFIGWTGRDVQYLGDDDDVVYCCWRKSRRESQLRWTVEQRSVE